VFPIGENGFQLALFEGTKIDLGCQLVAEHLALQDSCKDEINVEYVLELLKSRTQYPLYIFVVLVGVRYGDDVRLIMRNRLPLGFVICKESRENDITIEFSLICAVRKNVKLGLGTLMMHHVLQFYHGRGFNVRLYAISENLMFYYAQFGFVLVPLNYTCPIQDEYLRTWDQIVALYSNDFSRKRMETLTKQGQMPLAFRDYYQDRVFSQLLKNGTRDDFCWMVPTDQGEEHCFGLFMIFCQESSAPKLKETEERASRSLTYENVQEFVRGYVFKFDRVLRNYYFRKM
jgi:hypothetical protein